MFMKTFGIGIQLFLPLAIIGCCVCKFPNKLNQTEYILAVIPIHKDSSNHDEDVSVFVRMTASNVERGSVGLWFVSLLCSEFLCLCLSGHIFSQFMATFSTQCFCWTGICGDLFVFVTDISAQVHGFKQCSLCTYFLGAELNIWRTQNFPQTPAVPKRKRHLVGELRGIIKNAASSEFRILCMLQPSF